MSNLFTASAQWANRPSDQRFQTLGELKSAVNDRRLRSRSTDIDLSKIEARSEQGTIVLNSGVAAVEPSHWSFGQLGGWISAPASYLRTLPHPLAVDCLNHGIKSSAGEVGSLKFMGVTREDSEINTLQAVTSTTYGRIWDADVVAGVERVVEKSGGRFHNPLAYAVGGKLGGHSVPSGLYASDRDIFMFMIDGGSRLEAGPRAKLNRGFFVSNSEVGSRTFKLTTFLFNEVCGNHIVWGAKDVNELCIRHTANGPARFDTEATPQLMKYVDASPRLLEDQIKRACDLLIVPQDTKPDQLLTVIAEYANKRGKFTKAEVKSAVDFAKAEEGDCRTLWQLVQGFTAYARGFDWVDARIDLETRAGKLLDVVSNN
jgi:hypothetical protein